MSRFAAPARNEESRKALEERARQAAMPVSVNDKRKWPFTVANEDAVSEAEADADSHKPSGRDEHKSG